MSWPSAQVLEDRRAARAEVARVQQARADQLAALLGAGLSDADSAQLRSWADQLPGMLGDAWRDFIDLPLQAKRDALAAPVWGGMPWHSLLQCSPYARLPRWTPVPLRAYR